MRSHIPIPILILCATLLVLPLDSGAQEIATADLSQMKYRHIGPVGNRVTSVTGVVGDRFTYYAGAASGGVWKTDDAGLSWRPIFDDYPVHAIGEIAVAASDANIVWAGTGEPFLRSNVSLGNGVWKSTDAGENWTHMGLDATVDGAASGLDRCGARCRPRLTLDPGLQPVHLLHLLMRCRLLRCAT